ncbi:MAG: multicopper oxidase domain-containing protein [Rhodothermales bacterium]
MKITRREMLMTGAAALGSSLVVPSATAAGTEKPAPAPGMPGRDYTPVITPNGVSLPFKIVEGVKVFHLIAEEVWHEFAPGLSAWCWGYNGRVHGPTLEAVEGDQIRIYVTNRLKAATSIHWHGILLPNGMDGVGGLTQPVIQPGETFMYEYEVMQHGTFMYHSHHDEMTQMALGMMGMVVFHPRNPVRRVDRDYAIMLSEWRIDPGTSRPNPNEMSDFNVLTMNARCYPGTEALVAELGDRVRIRMGNLSAMDHHPIHFHGHNLTITATDGGPLPTSAQWTETSVLVPVGSTRDAEFIADRPGDWALHCHMTHHVMNQMGHDFPNMTGVDAARLNKEVRPLLPAYMTMGHDGMAEHGTHIGAGHMKVPENSIPMVGADGPFDYITMGGMFTIVKIREKLADNNDPGWYEHPEGTIASVATAEALKRDGITV